MTTLEAAILESVARYEREVGHKLPDNSFYKSIVLDIQHKERQNASLCNNRTQAKNR